MIDLASIPFRQARWYTQTYGRVIDYVVIHDMEYPTGTRGAEWCAEFFATSDRKGSTHYVTDVDSTIQCVNEHDIAWGANGVNHNGIHIEQAGFASQNWSDPDSVSTIIRCANLTAALCNKYNVPANYVDANGLLRHERGITTHAQAEIAFPYGGHTDPGVDYPIAGFIDAVRGFLMSDQATIASYIQQAMGQQCSRLVDRYGVKVIEIQLRDLSTERQMAHDWAVAHPGGEPWPLDPQFVWVEWGAQMQFDHLESGTHP